MDTEKARIFLTAVSAGSLSAASDILGYTTSGVSRSIASLEEETGLILLKRGRKGVEMTSEAELLLPVMRELVHQADLYKEITDRIRGLTKGTLTIGVSYAGYFKLIAHRLKEFSDRYPGIRIRTMQSTSSELLHAIERHECDFALMTYRDSGMNFRELRDDPMVACLPEDHPFLRGRKPDEVLGRRSDEIQETAADDMQKRKPDEVLGRRSDEIQEMAADDMQKRKPDEVQGSSEKSEHPGKQGFPIRLFETESFIAPFPDIETDYSRALEQAHVKPNIQYTTTDVYAAYCMVEAGLGVSLLNSLEVEFWNGNVRLVPVDPPVNFKIGIMYPEPEEMTIAARTFLKGI